MRHSYTLLLLIISSACVWREMYDLGLAWFAFGVLSSSRVRTELMIWTLRLGMNFLRPDEHLYWYLDRGGVEWGFVRGRLWMSHWMRMNDKSFDDFAKAARTRGLYVR